MKILTKSLLFIMLAVFISGCGETSENGSDSINSLGCEIIMFNIELDERELSQVFTINNAVTCNGSSNINVSFSGENAKYFLVNEQSSLIYNLNNGVNQGNSLDLTFSMAPEAETIQGTISATVVLKVSNYSTMQKFNQEYTITRLK